MTVTCSSTLSPFSSTQLPIELETLPATSSYLQIDQFEENPLEVEEVTTVVRDTPLPKRVLVLSKLPTLFAKDVCQEFKFLSLEEYDTILSDKPIESAKLRIWQLLTTRRKYNRAIVLLRKGQLQKGTSVYVCGYAMNDETIHFAVFIRRKEDFRFNGGRKEARKFFLVASTGLSSKPSVQQCLFLKLLDVVESQENTIMETHGRLSRVFSRLQIPSFIKYYLTLFDEGERVRKTVLCRFCEDGDLLDAFSYENERVVKEGGFFRTPFFLKAVLEGAKALCCLHANSFAHLDIKPQNFFRDGERNFIADYDNVLNFSTDTQFPTFPTGSAGYKAPELMVEENLFADDASACDVWAFGMSLFELFHLQEKDASTIVKRIQTLQYLAHAGEFIPVDNPEHFFERLQYVSSAPIDDSLYYEFSEFYEKMPDKPRINCAFKMFCYSSFLHEVKKIHNILRIRRSVVDPLVYRCLCLQSQARCTMDYVVSELKKILSSDEDEKIQLIASSGGSFDELPSLPKRLLSQDGVSSVAIAFQKFEMLSLSTKGTEAISPVRPYIPQDRRMDEPSSCCTLL